MARGAYARSACAKRTARHFYEHAQSCVKSNVITTGCQIMYNNERKQTHASARVVTGYIGGRG